MSASENWFDSFFHGPVVTFQRGMFPPEKTLADVALLEQFAELRPGMSVLDVPCGTGRIAVELAARGCRVSGLDLTAEFLADAAAAAACRDVMLDLRQGDMRKLPWRDAFDAAFCFGNSFSYFNDEGNAAFLAAVQQALRPGGVFVLQAYFVIESLVKALDTNRPRTWFPCGDGFMLHHPQYDVEQNRIETEYIFIQDGQVDRRVARYAMYSYRQLREMFAAAGFVDVRGYGAAADKPFTIDAGVLHLVGRKPTV